MNLTNLTKENFWNEMFQKYPDACKLFCDWIDKYKASVDWHLLFNPKRSIKFHDVPHAFQLGIWIHFVWDQGGCSWEIDDMFEFDLEEDIRHWFSSKQMEFDKHERDNSREEII